MNINRLLIAAAGAGKTTYLVNEALDCDTDGVLITTFTRVNEREIRRKITETNGCIPDNVTVQTWVSFLMQHGAKPFQGKLFKKRISGLLPVSGQSGIKQRNGNIPIPFHEDRELEQHFFSSNQRIHSDKLAKFVVKCNTTSNGAVINRINQLFQHVFVDEVQDLSGHDLDILKLFLGSSMNVLLVGDPRQATYQTHYERYNSGYSFGKIKEFVLEKCKGLDCSIDERFLSQSHRCHEHICQFASNLYPQFQSAASSEFYTPSNDGHTHNGVFTIKKADVERYLETFRPVQLRLNKGQDVNEAYPVMNYGNSKGLSFDRVLIYPTKAIKTYLTDGELKEIQVRTSKAGKVTRKEKELFGIAKFYVAVTRARHSVGIICDDNQAIGIRNIAPFNFEA